MVETRKSFQFVTGAKRLRQRVEDLEKELSEQKLVNQQQTLILLELIKVTNLNVQGIHFNWSKLDWKWKVLNQAVSHRRWPFTLKSFLVLRYYCNVEVHRSVQLEWNKDVSMSRNRRFNGLKITSNILSLLMSSQGKDFILGLY